MRGPPRRSGNGSPRRSPPTGRCASGSTRIRACSPSWGLADDARGLERFALTCVDALAGHVAVVKPQSAFFERHGSRGIAVLEKVLAGLAAQDARSAGDAVAARRQAGRHRLDDGRLRRRLPGGRCAAGRGRRHPLALPRLRRARVGDPDGGGRRSRRVRAGPDLQLRRRGGPARRAGGPLRGAGDRGRGGRRQPRRLAAGAAREQAESGSIAIGDGCGPGIPALGPVGVVVGATADHGLDLSALSGAVLAPGLGAQGATPADLAVRFAGVRGVLLPTASRSVLAAGPSSSAVRAAAAALRDELAAAQATAH